MGSHARIVIAGLSGDSGKTLVSLGLALAWRRSGRSVAAFKKGPDYIDAAWLGWASGGVARNLDVHLMGEEAVRQAFAWHARDADVSLIEGNRGLFDGLDALGSASTARLAVLLAAPVVLVVPATKMTATAAALVRGCQVSAPEVQLGGVVLNRVASDRQARVAADAIESVCGVPVLGVVPRLPGDVLPSRHLGLVPPAETQEGGRLEARLLGLAAEHLDLGRLERLAATAPAAVTTRPVPPREVGTIRVGYFNDSSFTFYYPENLEALEQAGASLEPISALTAERLPDLDLLYIGGGFPETHARALSKNEALRTAVAAAARAGLPIYAECGGLIYLSRSLHIGSQEHPMSAVLPISVEMTDRPQGHGYSDATVDTPNPYFPLGMRLRGHEFHYSRVIDPAETVTSVYAMNRGTGCGMGRDALVVGNVLASYTHLHARGVPEWAWHLCRAALRHRRTGRESHGGREESSQEGRQEDRRGWRCGRSGGRDIPPPPAISG